ncbi:MAG: helicase associated domain-containing protein [Verrucomicrobia bacterium]|nr:helicase associated domain-containing protein [Verrucomicrobiota bacterium]
MSLRNREWSRCFQALAAFKRKHRHLRVPPGWRENPELAKWVRVQRLRLGSLSLDQVEKLCNLGFDFGPLENRWLSRFFELAAFKEKHGHLFVRDIRATAPLGGWMRKQRTTFRMGTLALHRVRFLNALGFVWKDAHVAQSEHKWQGHFAGLLAFKKKHGHLWVPLPYPPHPQLPEWIQTQRIAFHHDKLKSSRVRLLNSLGFIWENARTARHQERWEKFFASLMAFRQKHGHLQVPSRHPPAPYLMEWVHEQRKRFREGKVPPDRVRLLNSIGFIWERVNEAKQDAHWKERFAALRAIKRKHGHLRGLGRHGPTGSLRQWIVVQRHKYRNGKLSPEQVRQLKSLGPLLDESRRFGELWRQRIETLLAFKKRHGHLLIPPRYPHDPRLSRWADHQRYQRRKGKLSADRIHLLNSVGFIWEDPTIIRNNDLWHKKYAILKEFKAQHGHLCVPEHYPPAPSLQNWVNTQRRRFHCGELSGERFRLLDSLGFSWKKALGHTNRRADHFIAEGAR